MKLTSKSIVSATALLVGGFIGASALVVLAAGTTTSTKGSVLSAIDGNGNVGWVATSSLGITGGGTIVGGSCPTGTAVGAVNTNGTVTCTTPPTSRVISCTVVPGGISTCNLICATNETIVYGPGGNCTFTSYSGSNEIVCGNSTGSTYKSGVVGYATCSK